MRLTVMFYPSWGLALLLTKEKISILVKAWETVSEIQIRNFLMTPKTKRKHFRRLKELAFYKA